MDTIRVSCVVQYTRGTDVQNASYQRCEHLGFPGASSVCNVLVPWTNPSPARGTSVHGGTANCGRRGDLSIKFRRP
eukprot:407524-Prorocentrum_minimum.AAC.1